MNLEMTFDDFKSKTMKDQPDQKPNRKKAEGPHFLSSRWWYPTAVTLGILCLGLLVTLIMLTVQLLQVSDLLKQQQANLTNQEIILEGQILAQKQAEKSSQESERELKETIETLNQKLDENSKKQMELHHQNLNLQEALRKAANFSEIHPANKCSFQFPILDGVVSEETQQRMALGGWLSFDAPLV
ncbi:oxidized low-density lipoprotein receptor 1 isoform X2 [Leptonychotes weddellii]|uniref:Oxidized low-density lipoprotein receptor 1 isoform X2 n=1 Tax=Leptonychotes weddellii TaxID=9713 RepID=A0A7F8QN53_LEPWE|nr:oxidized low-density lipoprotein receptor 1 isoform X2 [Leptonychotes weddellii]